MLDKQKAAEKLAGSFVPMTRWGISIRNLITHSFAIPFVPKFLRSSLLDRVALPDYSEIMPANA
jgi:hypothetical protein